MIIYCCHDRKCLNFLEHLWNLIAPIYVKKKKKIWWAAGIFGRYEYYTNQWHNLIQKKKFITNLNCWHNFKKKKPPHCSTMNFWTLNTSFAKFLNTKYFVFPNSFLCQNLFFGVKTNCGQFFSFLFKYKGTQTWQYTLKLFT